MIKSQRLESGVDVSINGTKEDLMIELGMILRAYLKSEQFSIEEITACICSAYKQGKKLERLIEIVEILKKRC